MQSRTYTFRLRPFLVLVVVSLAWAWIGLVSAITSSAADSSEARAVIEHVQVTAGVPIAAVHDGLTPLLRPSEDIESVGSLWEWEQPASDRDFVPAIAVITGNPNRAPPTAD